MTPHSGDGKGRTPLFSEALLQSDGFVTADSDFTAVRRLLLYAFQIQVHPDIRLLGMLCSRHWGSRRIDAKTELSLIAFIHFCG